MRIRFIVKHFINNLKGAALPLIAVLGTALIGVIGAATDIGRTQITQSRLSGALDAAALAAAKYMDDPALAEKEVRRYTEANFQNYLNGELYDFEVNINDSRTRMEVKSKVRIPAIFMRIFQTKELQAYAETAVEIGRGAGEIVLLLDSTASLGAAGLESLKTAAKNFVTDVLINNGVRIGLIQFGGTVNIGTENESWMTGVHDWGPTAWGGCTKARLSGNYDLTDEPPSVAAIPKYYATCFNRKHNHNAWYGNNPPSYDNCATGGGDFKFHKDLTNRFGPNQGCVKEPMISLQSDPNVLIASIDRMEVYNGTDLPVPMVWGWRMLSPKWRGLWGGEMKKHNLPADYAKTPSKFVILMSDGQNDTNGNDSAYGLLATGKFGFTDKAGVEKINKILDERLLTICQAMKENNIVIYNIALGAGLNKHTRNLLRECVTSPEYALEAEDVSKLNENFQKIASELNTAFNGAVLAK